MPTFQRTETVDARQFTGGLQNGMDLVLWVNSNNGTAMYQVEKDVIFLYVWGKIFTVHKNDMIALRQDGKFEHIRLEDFQLLGYKEV